MHKIIQYTGKFIFVCGILMLTVYPMYYWVTHPDLSQMRVFIDCGLTTLIGLCFIGIGSIIHEYRNIIHWLSKQIMRLRLYIQEFIYTKRN